MDTVGLIGIRWQSGGSQDLAPFTIPVDDRAHRLPEIGDRLGAKEFVYLATCNRVEVTLVTQDNTPLVAYRPRLFEALTGSPPEPGQAERTFKVWGGEGAAEHLFLVASGLDSSMVGETEIIGQMRSALTLASELELSGARTEWLFEEAWKVAKRVRQHTALGAGKVSLAAIALEHAGAHLSDRGGVVGLVGVSPMTERCARELAHDGIPMVIFNRTLERAEELAEKVGAVARPLSAIGDGTDAIDVVISATGAPGAVLRCADLERLASRTTSTSPPLLIDLANPPDIDAADAHKAGLPRIGLDDILREAEQHRSQRLARAVGARAVVDQALVDLDHKMIDAALGPLFAALQQRYRTTALKGIDRLFSRHLADLSDERREAIRAWALTLARRMVHVPTVGLRAVARESGFDAVETFFAAADADLAKMVGTAARTAATHGSITDAPEEFE